MNNIQELWENEWKLQVLSEKLVPQELAAKILGMTKASLQARIRAGAYPFAKAFKLESNIRSEYIYEIYPLQFIKWYEGSQAIDADKIGISVFNRMLAYFADYSGQKGYKKF